MNRYFVDTSALAKLYIPETGSQWLRMRINPAAKNSVLISELTHIEMMSLFARHYREKKITQADLKIISNGFLAHLRQHYQTIPIQRQVVRTARRLVFAYSLRSLDAIQLASSVVARLILKAPLTFISADQKLLDIAQLEGFTIENPQHYP